jgi:hypothetical protein
MALAMARTDLPLACRATARSISMRSSRGGLPIGLPLFVPFDRTRSMPARVRSTSLRISCSATQEKIASRRSRTGPPVSSHGSRRLMSSNACPVEREGVAHVARHRAPEAIERPHEQHAECPAPSVGHHAVELRAPLGSARVLRVRRHDRKVARSRELVKLRALVFEGLAVRAHTQIDRRRLFIRWGLPAQI